MTLLQTIMPMPIYFNSGHSRPMTEQESKVLLGCIILLHAVWVLLLIVTFISWLFLRKKELWKGTTFFEYINPIEGYLPFGMYFFNSIMIGIVILESIVFFGYQISKFL